MGIILIFRSKGHNVPINIAIIQFQSQLNGYSLFSNLTMICAMLRQNNP